MLLKILGKLERSVCDIVDRWFHDAVAKLLRMVVPNDRMILRSC